MRKRLIQHHWGNVWVPVRFKLTKITQRTTVHRQYWTSGREATCFTGSVILPESFHVSICQHISHSHHLSLHYRSTLFFFFWSLYYTQLLQQASTQLKISTLKYRVRVISLSLDMIIWRLSQCSHYSLNIAHPVSFLIYICLIWMHNWPSSASNIKIEIKNCWLLVIL